MRVLISGYYGFHNIGDEAILKSIVTSLREDNPSIKITVLSNDIEHTKKTYNVDAINRWNLPVIYSHLLKSDGLISGGGSLLQDATSSRPVIYYTAIMKLAKLAKKPVFIYAQGVGPITNEKNKKIVKKQFNKCDYITLRDQESIDFIKDIGVTKSVDLVPDPVMGFSIENFQSDLCKKYEFEDYVTISVRDWNKATTNFLEKVATTCDEIVLSGRKVVFIPMHGEYDHKVSKGVVDIMNEDAEIFNYKASIEEKILCIKNSKLMIGMRLHALIFAATVDTPMIGISYDPKIDSFLKLVNQPCIGTVDENWTSDELANKSKDVLDNYEEVKLQLNKEASRLIKLAKETSKLALNVFAK